MDDDLIGKIMSVVVQHFADWHDPLQMRVEVLRALAAVAAAVVNDEPICAEELRAVFDKMLTRGLDRLRH